MAHPEDQPNLKSLQKLSQADVHLLNQLSKNTATACAYRQESKASQRENLFLRLSPRKVSAWLRAIVDNMLFETVPKSEVYISRE